MVLGLEGEELVRVLDLMRAEAARGSVVTIFLTDTSASELFRRRRLLFEYLMPPALQQRFAPDLDWDLYCLRRLALLRRKWQPVRIVAFGATANRILAAWRASRFEEGTPGPDLGNLPPLRPNQ